jgi:paraquat-inducible protein B
MNKQASDAGDKLPRAKTRRRKWDVPYVWMVPVAATLVAGYLVYQRVGGFGPSIEIRFRDVNGVRPGQTPVQYHGGDIGQVTSVTLDKDQQYTTVRVKLRRYASSMAREGAVFWIVRPQLAMGDLSGLGTLVTGPYIDVLPGQGKATTKFTGVEHSPVALDPNGLTVVLLASEANSLRAGVPVYYRGLEVGIVKDAQLSTNATAVEITCVIRRRYAALVRAESRFWNVTGLDVRIGLFRGAEVNVESLKSLLIGGIAFATPDNFKSEPAHDGAVFRLHTETQKEWSKWSPTISLSPTDTAGSQPKTNPSRDSGFPQNTPTWGGSQ